MDADFSIRVDAARDLMCITLSGFFEEDDQRRFMAALRDGHRQLRCAANQHLTLIDVRELRIQAQDTVAGFGSVLANPLYRARRLAFVVGSTLARMQVLRAAAGRNARFFTDRRMAEQWLFAADENETGHETRQVRTG